MKNFRKFLNLTLLMDNLFLKKYLGERKTKQFGNRLEMICAENLSSFILDKAKIILKIKQFLKNIQAHSKILMTINNTNETLVNLVDSSTRIKILNKAFLGKITNFKLFNRKMKIDSFYTELVTQSLYSYIEAKRFNINVLYFSMNLFKEKNYVNALPSINSTGITLLIILIESVLFTAGTFLTIRDLQLKKTRIHLKKSFHKAIYKKEIMNFVKGLKNL